MRIIANELKKIWKIKILAVIAVLCTLFYMWFMDIHIANYPINVEGMNIGAMQVSYARYLTERFASPLEPGEVEEFLLSREEIIAEVNQFIQSRPMFTEYDVFSYEDFESLLEVSSANNDELRAVEVYSGGDGTAIIMHGGGAYLDAMFFELSHCPAYFRLGILDGIVWMYNERDDWIDRVQSNIAYNAPLREMRIARLHTIRDSGELQHIMTPQLLHSTLGYGQMLSMLAILSTLILVSPLIVTDRASRVNWLQYTSKQGRKILGKQFLAVLISAAFMTTILVLIFAGLFGLATGAHVFWNNGINSFMGFPLHWLSITYGQYCLLIISVIYLLSIYSAAFAFILSRFSQNKIRLMFKIIPLFVSAVLLSMNWVLQEFLSVFERGNIFIHLLIFLFSIIAGIGISMLVIRREKKAPLL